MNGNSRSITSGFTLVEILLVILIMGISAALIVPMVGNRDDIVVAAASRKIVTDLQYAQNYAIATRANVYIKFEEDQYSICTLSGTTLTPITHPIEKGPFVVQFGAGGDSNLSRVALPQAAIATKSVLGFDALGTPFAFDSTTQVRSDLTAAASFSMTSGSLTQQINIEPYTGEITVP